MAHETLDATPIDRIDADQTADLLRRTAELAAGYQATIPRRRVGIAPGTTSDTLRAALDRPLPTHGTDAWTVIQELAADVEPGLVTMNSPRYHGFVIGGAVPAALAADWLTSVWDQNAAMMLATPAAAVVEDIAARWLVELLGLPPETSVGFTTGATMSNFTGLAAGRHAVLRRVGWDVEEHGLQGAPTIRVLVGADYHASLQEALRYVGFGRGRAERIPTDDEGRMDGEALRAALAGHDDPTIVCAQLGEVNTGAFDPIGRIADAVAAHPNAWLHVDGAFGLWAAASPRLRHLVAGHDRADSWGTDAHKWLNVPYDSGFVFVKDAAAHRASMGATAAYLPPAPGQQREPFEYVPEMSRRGRGFVIYAALRELGADGVAELVERGCTMAARIAAGLMADPGVRLLNEVVLNQVLLDVDGDADLTRDVIARVQADGEAWLGGTTFHGTQAIRVSVSNWDTREDDADRTVEAIRRAISGARAGRADGHEMS